MEVLSLTRRRLGPLARGRLDRNRHRVSDTVDHDHVDVEAALSVILALRRHLLEVDLAVLTVYRDVAVERAAIRMRRLRYAR